MADADFSVKAIISAQTSQFEKGMKNAQSSINTMSKSIEGVQKLLKSAFSIVGIGVSIKAVTDFGRSCVQSATQAQKAFNILDNTVKATGADAWTSTKELEDASKSLSASTNYSVTEIQKMQSVLLGFTNITGEAFDEASNAVLDMATVMGMDLTSAVQTVGKALDDPITGLDSLRRQGFKFTDEQKAELAQLVKNGKKLEAQKIILDTLATSYGGAAKAGQDSFAKQRHAVENFKDALGGKLIPVMQVFAENNSKMINNLTEFISKIDFTPIVNVVTNLSNVFNSTFEKISNYLRDVKNEVTDFISRFNFEPIISILDTFIGVISGVINKFKEMNSQKLDVFNNIKESLISFSNSETFQNIVNFINKIVDAVFFLWSEIQDIAAQIRQMIVGKIVDIWNKIKEFFENSRSALENSGQDIASWGDYFWNILNGVFRTFQDLINGIKAILNGDWQVAWEYAKLAVMRVGDNILEMISTIANAFPELINGMIKALNGLIGGVNKVREFFGQDPLGLIEAFESVDLSKKTGLTDKIKETEDKIQELTGHVADTAIKDLDGVSTKFAGFTRNALNSMEDLTDDVKDETEKQKEYFTGTTSGAESSYKMLTEWDQKLLEQRLNKLKEYGKEYTDEYHDIQMQLLRTEKERAIQADKTGSEIEKINEYYNNETAKADEEFNKQKRNHTKETITKVINYMKSMYSNAVNILKKMINAWKNVFSAITKLVKNAFNGIKDTFKTLFDFNVDEALNKILEFEDKVLTFFVETLPKLPGFVESVLTSIITLIDTLLSNIDWDEIGNLLDNIVKSFVKHAPRIARGLVEVFTKILQTVAQTLIDNSDMIVNAIGEMVFAVIEALPMLIRSVINALGTFLKSIGDYIVENGEQLTNDLVEIVRSVIDGITNFITSGGWKTLIRALLTIFKAIHEAVIQNIDTFVEALIEGLPDFMEALLEAIVVASHAMAKMMKPLVKLIVKFVLAFLEIAFSEEALDASMEVAEEFLAALIEVLITELPRVLPKLIIKIVAFVIKSVPKSIIATIKAIAKVITETDWGEVAWGIIEGLRDAFFEIGDQLWKVFDWINNAMKYVFGDGWNWVVEGATWAWNQILGGFKWAFEGIGWFFNEVINGIKWGIEQIKAIFDSLASGWNWFWGGPASWFGWATGTNDAPKGLALVGEQGPELVKFNGGEQVLNTRNTQKLLAESGKGSGNTFNVTFNNLQDTSAFTMMNQLKQYNRQMAINGVI